MDIPARVVKGDFFSIGLTLEVVYSGRTEIVYIDREMFDEDNLALLETEGVHEVELSFGGKKVRFTIEILPSDAFKDGKLYFRFLTGGETVVCGFEAEGTEAARAVIPSSVRGYPVTGIDAYAFKNSAVAYVYLPDSVSYIGNGAFYGCANLEYFLLPTSVTKLGSGIWDGGGKPYLKVLEVENPDVKFPKDVFLGCSDELTVFVGRGELYGFIDSEKNARLNVYPVMETQEIRGQIRCDYSEVSGKEREIRFGDEDISVGNTYKLYWAVMLGMNPVPEKDSAAETLLTEIKRAVCEATDPDADEKDNLLGIYEYICRITSENTDVDEKTALNHGAFLPEGVFLARSAVCDGYAKAFNLMARAVGIISERASGYYTVGSGKVYHAWNRVFYGGVWYETDVSRGDIYRGLLSDGREYTTHFYLLCGEGDSENVSTDGLGPQLSGRHDWYSERGLVAGSDEELNALVAEHREKLLSGGYVEIHLKTGISPSHSLMKILSVAFSAADIEANPDVRFLLNHPDGGGVYLIGAAET